MKTPSPARRHTRLAVLFPARPLALTSFGLVAVLALGGMGSRLPGSPPDGQVTASLDRYKSDVLAYFKHVGLLPIIVPEGQRVGDIYNPSDNWVLKDRASRCFPKLDLAAAEPSVLPDVILNSVDEAGTALGLAKLLNLSASTDRQQRVVVAYSDVTFTRASQGELRDALDAKCEYLRPIVDETVVPPADVDVKVIIGKVFYARPIVFFATEDAAAAKAQLDSLSKVLPTAAALALRGLDADASVSLGFGQRHGVLVESKVAVPVAFAPAFLVKPVFDRTLGASSDASVLKGYRWQQFDTSSEEQRMLFEHIVDASVR